MTKILIVEDNEGLREQMKWALRDYHTVVEAGTSVECLEKARNERPRIVCLDMGLDNIPDKGMELIDALININRETKIIVITAHTSESLGAQAIYKGAFDYLKKPVDIDQLKVIISRAERMIAFEHKPAEQDEKDSLASAPDQYIIGSSKKMLEIFGIIKKLAATDVNVLITGESGTGKEVCARAIHFNSGRRDAPFVPINCGAIPETLLESELFGYVKGAFTGASADKKGLIQAAENGTLFLDEIGDMPKNLQVKLLRFIDSHTFLSLGSTITQSCNVRIIAATNRTITADNTGVLRSDLYYRLSEFEIHLPPLKDRDDDVITLAKHIIERNREKFNMPRLSLSSRAEKILLHYNWPGNVRELENKLGRATILCTNQVIEPADLQLSVASLGNLSLKMARDMFDKEYIEKALLKTDYTISTAAELLDVSRPTLYDLIKKLGIRMKGT
jgi:two-component system, NtrC family, response regulator